VEARHDRERRILPVVAERARFAVPRREQEGEWDGRRFHLYRCLPGRRLRPGDRTPEQLAGMLRAVHDAPVEQARELLEDEGTVAAWKRGYEPVWSEVEAKVVPLLDEATVDGMRYELEVFLDDQCRFEPALIHGDLGHEHILVEGDATAVIDWEHVAVGDPAHDFVGFANLLDRAAVRDLHVAYRVDTGRPGRTRFYRWMGAAQAVLYGLEVGDEDEVAGAAASIVEKVRGRPRVTAAVVRDGRILMARYNDQFWTLPGGGVEPGEDPEAAAVRELAEETGITGARVVGELYRDVYWLGPARCFLVDVGQAEPSLTGDPQVTDVAWFTLEEKADDHMVARVRTALAGGRLG
jgi:8-oxo-dGTP diphosphatase